MNDLPKDLGMSPRAQRIDNSRAIIVSNVQFTSISINTEEPSSRNKVKKIKDKGITDYVKQIPRAYINLVIDQESSISGTPIKSSKNARGEQKRRNRSLTSSKLGSPIATTDRESSISQQAMIDWKKNLRSGSRDSGMKQSSVAKRFDEIQSQSSPK